MMTALVMTVSTAPRARVDLALPHAVADHLAAAELHLLAVGGEILLDLDEQLGVGEPHPVARGRAEHVGIGGAGSEVGGSALGRLAMGGLLERVEFQSVVRTSRRRRRWPKAG